MRLVENAIVAGKFRLNRMLGGGGMGSVWHATHLGLDIPCAVKFVKGELLEQDEIKARFEREAKAAAQLRSPHVVQILDHGVCEGTPYIAMELLDGEDLGSRLERMGRLPPEQLYKILSEACRALSKAHAQGIVHRDLKPDNIYLVRDDDREITKVLDFGIAKTNTTELGGSGTKTGAMLGTPYYMSPEQAQGTKAVDARSDLWALAVIAFQSLTGRLPFESEALGDLLIKIIVAPIPLPSQYASVPPTFDAWWQKASAREPAERFQTAKEFSDALALVCGISHVSGVIDRGQLGLPDGGGPRGVQTMNTASRTAPSTGSVPIGVALAQTGQPLAPGAAGVTGSGVTPAPLSRSYVDGGAPPNATGKGLVVAAILGGALFVGVLGGAGWFLFGRSHTSASTAGPAASDMAVAAPPPKSASVATAPAVPSAAAPSPVAAAETSASPPAAPAPAASSATPSPAAAAPASHSRAAGGTAKPTPSPASTTPKPSNNSSKPADMGF